MSNVSKKSVAAGTAPDALDALRRAKRQLASFDAVMAASGGAVTVQTLQVNVTAQLHDLPADALAVVGKALRPIIERHLTALLGDARDQLIADLESAKQAAKLEYEAELATVATRH